MRLFTGLKRGIGRLTGIPMTQSGLVRKLKRGWFGGGRGGGGGGSGSGGGGRMSKKGCIIGWSVVLGLVVFVRVMFCNYLNK
jgi:hypothetical protein